MSTGNETTSSAPTIASKRALVVGATSSLAQALCHALAKDGYALVLSGRNQMELELQASDLVTRYNAQATSLVADLTDPRFSADMFLDLAGECDTVIIAAGDMGGSDPTDADNIAYTSLINYTIPAQIAAGAARRMNMRRSGMIVIISSVAGDRGRQSNFVYGSAKAGLSAFASGLRNKFAKRGIHVMTVKPGFIDTPMTWGMESPLIASRDYAAKKILKAMGKRKDIVYVPFFWRYIMLIITHIPEKLFKRLSL